MQTKLFGINLLSGLCSLQSQQKVFLFQYNTHTCTYTVPLFPLVNSAALSRLQTVAAAGTGGALSLCISVWKRSEESRSLHLCICVCSSFVSWKHSPLLCASIVDLVFYTPLIPSWRPPRWAGQCSLMTGKVLSVTRNGPFFWVSLKGPGWKEHRENTREEITDKGQSELPYLTHYIQSPQVTLMHSNILKGNEREWEWEIASVIAGETITECRSPVIAI